MTPQPAPAPSGAWWQTILAGLANAALAGLLSHYLGPVAGGAAAAAGTAAAYRALPPQQR